MGSRPDHRLVTPIGKEAFRRAARLRELGIEEPDPEFDEFARHLAQSWTRRSPWSTPFAQNGSISPGRTPPHRTGGSPPETDPFRTMACDCGYCMYVVTRQHAMALDEVMDYYLFAGNPVVDQIGSSGGRGS
jgi:hypothetical protein